MENTVCDNGGDGICLHSSNHNDIRGNVVTNNSVGINLVGGSKQNNVIGNTVKDNSHGIGITASNYNLIYNNIINNTNSARDYGTINNWDNGAIGNYWSDYPGKDIDDDGIGDTSYNITGDAHSQDNYPIWWDPIVFSITTSNPNDAFSHTSLDFTITINEGILNTLWYTIDGGLTIIPCNTSDKISQTTWDELDDGNFTLTCSATDAKAYITTNSIMIQKDTIAPIISLNSPIPNSIYKKDPPDYNISIIEVNLFSTWYTIENIAENFNFTGLIGTINQTVWNDVLKGEVNITFYAQDRAGNIGRVSVIVIKSVSSKPPFGLIIITIASITGVLGIAAATLVLLRKRKKTSEGE